MNNNKPDNIEKVIEGYSILQEMKSFDKDRAKSKLFARTIYAEKRSNKVFYLLRLAAIILLPVLSSLITYLVIKENHNIRERDIITISAPKVGVLEYTLPDGSEVWLGGGSEIVFSSTMANDISRDVEIKGECYLDVEKDTERLFNVKIGDVKVTVKGTEFNCYKKGEDVAITLVDGLVYVSDSNGDIIAHLHPNQQLIYNENTKISAVNTVNCKPFAAWKDGEMCFIRASLDFVADRIEQQFNIRVSIENESLRSAVINANFAGEELHDILDIISTIVGGNYKIENEETNGLKIKNVTFY